MIKILTRDEESQEYGKQTYSELPPTSHTLKPITTGSSVIGLVYKDGVVIASDTQVSYGSMVKLKDQQRVAKINDTTVLASSGEYSDWQEACNLMEKIEQKSRNEDDGIQYNAKDYANYLARVNYQHRNKFNPLYINSIVGGFQKGEKYLAMIDIHGALLEGKSLVTGMANYFSKPIIWNDWNENQSEEEVKEILIRCFKVLFYRDVAATDNIHIAVVNKNGVKIDKVHVDSKWDYKLAAERANEKLHTR